MAVKDERVKFQAKLAPDLHRWLKVSAAQHGEDMNARIARALRNLERAEAAPGICTSEICSVWPFPHPRQAGCPGGGK